jgi:hypothetical protein
LDHAKSLLKNGGTLWSVGPIDVSNAQTLNLSNKAANGADPGMLKRWDGTTVSFTNTNDTAAYTGAIFTVQSQGVLTLSNIVIDGNKANVTAAASIMGVSGGQVALKSGTVLKNNKMVNASNNATGAITLFGGVVTMEDGASIQDNWGGQTGAIYSYPNAGTSTITIKGGTISGNVGGAAGAIFLFKGATTTDIQGGSITGNVATNEGGCGAISASKVFGATGAITLEDQADIEGNASTGTTTALSVASSGGIFDDSTVSITLSGNAKVTNNTNGATWSETTGLQAGTTASNLSFGSGVAAQVDKALNATAHIGVTTVAADHVKGHVFANGLGYTVTDSDATAFSDDNATSLAIEKTPSENSIRFANVDKFDNVFVGSTTASDNSSQIAASDAASGASPSKAVSSFAHAKSLLNKGGTIWVVGPIDVPEAQMWDMAGMAADGTGSGSLKRWDGTTVSFTDQADTNPFTTDSMVVLSAAASQLSVTNMTIDGNKVPVSITTNTSVTSDHGPAVSLRSTGSFTLGSGATIKDVDLSTAGGYWVQGGAISNYHGGTVTMNAGSLISGCKSEVGSAVWCSGTSVFNMTGGSISGCGGINNNQSGGEVVILNDSVFNMSGGSITHNTASDSGFCAVNLRTGGTLNMSGTASITDNGLIGVYKAASTTIKLSGGATIDNNTRSTSPANIYCQATVDASGTPTNPIYVTGALTGKIGIRVVSADHVQGHEFALGDSYTVTDTDAAVFSDDNTPALTIDKTPGSNTIRFSSLGDATLTKAGADQTSGEYHVLSGSTFNLYRYVGTTELTSANIDTVPLAGTDTTVWQPITQTDGTTAATGTPVAYTSGSDGVLKSATGSVLPKMEVGTCYALVETASTVGYTTPTGQWAIKLVRNNGVVYRRYSNEWGICGEYTYLCIAKGWFSSF